MKVDEDIENLLYKVYRRRKTMVDVFWAITSSLSVLLLAIAFLEIIPDVDNIVIGNWAEVSFQTFSTWLAFGLGFALLIPVYFCGSIRKGLKIAKPKIDYLNTCIETLDLVKRHSIKLEAIDFFRGLSSRNKIQFGCDCLYGRAIYEHWRDVSYHVILPYKNIKQIMLHKSLEKDLQRNLINVISAVSVVISIAGLLSGVGGLFVFASQPALMIIVDDNGNYHHMSCGPNSAKTKEALINYVKQILEHSVQIEIGFAE